MLEGFYPELGSCFFIRVLSAEDRALSFVKGCGLVWDGMFIILSAFAHFSWWLMVVAWIM